MASSAHIDSRQNLLDQAHEGSTQAQYQLGLSYYRDSALGQARRWLKRAAKSGHSEAAIHLADQYLYGRGVTESRSEAIGILTFPASDGDPECCYRLAGLLQSKQPGRSQQWLRQALQTGSGDAWLFMAVIQKGHDHGATAADCLSQAARFGSSLATTLSGDSAETSEDGYASRLIRQSIAVKSMAAEECSQQIPELDTLLDDLNTPWPVRQAALLPDSPILINDDLLNPWACLAIIDELANWVQPSRTIDPLTGKHQRNPVRTSDGWTIHPDQESCLLKHVRHYIAYAWGLPVDDFEPASVLRYLPGQEYRPHVDYIDPVSERDQQDIDHNGQRLKTILICLHAPNLGGSTHFPRLDVDIAARQGRMIQFSNVTESGQVDPMSQHAGQAVESGEKWMMALWLRGHA